MKTKILATLASVLLAGSMLAQNLNTESIAGSMLGGANPSHDINILSMQKVSELDGTPIKRAKNGDVFTIEGDYTLSLFDYGTKTTSTVTATITQTGNNYYLNEENFLSNIPFTFRNNTLTFTPQYFGTVNIGQIVYARVEPFKGGDRNSTTTFTRQSSMSVPFDASTGTIQFESPSGFCWAVYSSSTNFNNNTYLGIVGAKEFTSCVQIDPWPDAGTAIFMDGWVSPEFGYDQKDVNNWYEVPLQQDANNPKRYRLVDPYHCNPYFKSGDNTSTTTGYINFDISDENHVIVETGVEAGWANTSEGITKFYCFNSLAYQMAFYNKDAQTVIKEHGSDIPYTTYKNGVIDLGSINMPILGLTYDAIFGYNNTPLSGDAWGDGRGNFYDMTARIIMPGGIAVGIANSTVAANNEADKTATISFDFKTFNAPSLSTVYATLSDGKGYSKRVQVSGTHADVELTDLQPLTSYTMTLTLEVVDRFGTSVATSFPTTVTFTTLEEIVVPDPEIDAPAFVMVAPYETIDLSSYFSEVEVAAWTTADDNIAAVEAGKVIGQNYGETTVTATRPKGGEWATIKVLVCPSLTVLYPEGVETTHLVGYASPIDVKLGANNGWRVCTASVDGRDITAQIEANGWLLSNMTVTDDTTVNIVTAKTTNPSWADGIRIIVDGRDVSITGAGPMDNVTITNYKDDTKVYNWNVKEIPFSEGGVFNVKITNNENGQEAYFRMVIK